MGWLTYARDGPTSSGVLMMAPIGYEWWSSHRTLRTVAERLAAGGHAVLRFDYDGTGDSAGSGREPDRVASWRASVAAGVCELRELGCRRLVLLGSVFGGLLAVLDGSSLAADAIVAWSPPASGKRFVHKLRLLSEEVPGEDGAMTSSGAVFSIAALDELKGLDPGGLVAPPASRVALFGGHLGPLTRRLRDLGTDVTEADLPDTESVLSVPTENAVVPESVVGALVEAVGEARGERLPAPAERAEATFEWDREQIRERVVRLGDERLVGVLTTPAEGPGGTVIVWLNSGSEPHVGPGRAWVEYARELARDGRSALRLDFSGWGESPDRGHAPGRPYDAHGVAEAAATVAALRGLGYRRIVLAGLCAGAWIALRVALEEPVAGVVALNPQLYWQPGDPVEALMRETRVRRSADRRREERGRRYGLWTLLDRLGYRPWAGRWLDQLAAAKAPVLLCFADDDDGIEFLRNRLSRRLAAVTGAGGIEVVEIPGVDHSMYRVWLRDRVVAETRRFVRACDE